MKQAVLAIVVLCLAGLGCGGPSLITPGDYVKEFGGDISIFTRILEMTSCRDLEIELERADENAKLHKPGTQEYKSLIGYRIAAERRMQEVECDGHL
jgi:hypothetical protein